MRHQQTLYASFVVRLLKIIFGDSKNSSTIGRTNNSFIKFAYKYENFFFKLVVLVRFCFVFVGINGLKCNLVSIDKTRCKFMLLMKFEIEKWENIQIIKLFFR